MQTITQNTLADTMYYNDIPVFKYTINYPSFQTTCSKTSAGNINEYYILKSQSLEDYCRTVLYPQAAESARYIPANQPPFYSYELLSEYHVTFNSRCVTSLYTDQYTFMGGAHGSTIRTSETWDFLKGRQLKLHAFYPDCPAFPENIIDGIEQQVQSSGSYFDDDTLLGKNFSTDNYYLTPEGVTIYYQQYDIAPYSAGIPEFEFLFSL